MANGSDPPGAINRRQLLATMAMGAVAGCGSNDQDGTTREMQSPQEQRDCIDRSQYEDLYNEYETVREQNTDLRDRLRYAKAPPYIQTGKRTIGFTYETLDDEIQSWEWDSDTLSAQITSGNFVRELTYAQLDYLGLGGYGFEGGSKYRQLGDFGYYYQLNPFVVAANFPGLADEMYNLHTSNRERIREAWHFTTQMNDYVSEIEETPRYPLETLLLGGGDCEDSAILLASILYAMPGELDPTFWYIDADNPIDPQSINHVILSAETEMGPTLIETTTSTMSPFDEVNGFSVPVEPVGSFRR